MKLPNRSSRKQNQISLNLMTRLVDPNTMPPRRPTRSCTVKNKKSTSSTSAVARRRRRPPSSTRKTKKATKAATSTSATVKATINRVPTIGSNIHLASEGERS